MKGVSMRHFISVWNRTSLIKRIVIGVVLGLLLGMLIPNVSVIGMLGDLFVGGLKAIAPLLVFALLATALLLQERVKLTNMSSFIGLYLIVTLAATLVVVMVKLLFLITFTLDGVSDRNLTATEGIAQVF